MRTIESTNLEDFDRCRTFIQDSIRASQSLYTVDDFYGMLVDGMIRILLCYEDSELIGCVLVQYHKENDKIASIAAMGGKHRFMKDYMQLVSDAVERVAKRDGKTRMLVQGRRAWHRFEKLLGYTHITSTFGKDL